MYLMSNKTDSRYGNKSLIALSVLKNNICNENHDIAIAMSSSRADPVMG